MRTGVILFVTAIAISALLHVLAVLVGVAWTGKAKTLEAAPAEAVTVDIVRPEELALAGKPPSPKAEPATSLPAEAPVAPNQSPFDPAKLAAMFPVSPVAGTSENATPEADATPRSGNGFDAPAASVAKLSSAEVAAFKAHLKKCWTLPAGVTTAEKLKIVFRLSLTPDGALKTQPMLLEASASPFGPAVAASVMSALRQCQPYNFLPVDKYAEWKVLDVSFSPRDMAGG